MSEHNFEENRAVGIEDFTYEEACAIFGKPLVDSYYKTKDEPTENFIVTEIKPNANGTMDIAVERMLNERPRMDKKI